MIRRRGGRLVVSAPVAVLVALSLASCSSGQSSAPAATATVTRGTVSTGVRATGSLAAAASENLGFVGGGRLTAVEVKVGDHVTSGQELATIDAYALKRVLAQQQATLASQEALLRKVENSTGVSGARSTLRQSEQVVDAARAQVSATRKADDAAIRRAKKQLSAAKKVKDAAEDGRDDADDACDSAPETTKATACAGVATARSGVASAGQGVEAARTAVTAAEQRKNVDLAAGRSAVASSEGGVVAARNGLDAAATDQPANVDQQRALVDAAAASVAKAQRDVRDTTLRAPFDGTVAAVNGRVGEYLTASTGTTALAPGASAAVPGAAAAGAAAGAATATRPGGAQFLVLTKRGRLQAVIPFEQSDATQLRQGQHVTLEVDALPGFTPQGTVTSIAPTGTAIGGVISYYATVQVASGDTRLRDGQTVRASVATQERTDVLTVPNAAVHQQGAVSTVVVVDPGGQQRTVTFTRGVVGADRTEVVGGLNAGDVVVVPAVAR